MFIIHSAYNSVIIVNDQSRSFYTRHEIGGVLQTRYAGLMLGQPPWSWPSIEPGLAGVFFIDGSSHDDCTAWRPENTERSLDVVLMVAGRRRYGLVDYFAGRAAQLSYTLLLQVTFIYHVYFCYDLKPVSKASGAIHNTELQLKHAVKNIVCKAIMAMSIN